MCKEKEQKQNNVPKEEKPPLKRNSVGGDRIYETFEYHKVFNLQKEKQS